MSVKLMEFDLDVYDSPGIRNFTFTCKTVKPVCVVNVDDSAILRVEVDESDEANHRDYRLMVELHGTGWLIPNVHDVTYLGTVIIDGGYYVWHTFYLINEITQTEDKNTDTVKPSKVEDIKASVIYKYPLPADNGGLIEITGTTVKPLWVDEQRGRFILWAMISDLESSGLKHLFNIVVSQKPLPKEHFPLNTIQTSVGNTLYTGYKEKW